MVNKPWVTVILLLGAAVLFTVGAIELPTSSLEEPMFDLLVGLVLASIGLAIWAAPA